tara:strand:- start:1880 stop:2338 length:459 start_codon:yes stop_codon:yes gene_type:complete
MKITEHQLYRSENGFSMIEITLSLAIMVLVSSAVMNGISTGVRNTRMVHQSFSITRDCEMLLEEVSIVPYELREATFDGLYQESGELTDYMGDLLPDFNQSATRSVEIQHTTIPVQFGSVTSVDCLSFRVSTVDVFAGEGVHSIMFPVESLP